MDRDTKLKEFAAALFSHVYREYNTTFDLPVKLPHVFSHHAPQDSSKEEAAAVLRLCLALRGVFNGIFVKSFETFQRSTQHFMTFLTSRCLKLCAGGEEDVFLSFCMVCAFVAELNLFCLINGCFAFMATAPKCLQAIFNRRLRKEFYASGGWESLRFFAVHFARDVSPEDVVSEGLLASIKNKLDEDSSEDESSSEEDEEDNDEDEDNEDNEADNEEDNEEKASVVAPPPALAMPPPPVAVNDSEDDSSDDSESELDSDDSDSDDESEEEVVASRPNGSLKRPREDTLDDSDEESEAEAKRLPNGHKPQVDSDDDSDSEEEEDTSSMSDEEEETEDSESDAAPSTVQTNCIKPIMQKNLNVDKKVL